MTHKTADQAANVVTLLLTFSVQGAEPYVVDTGDARDRLPYGTLAECIETESYTVAGEADADHLEDPSDETREAFRLEVVKAAKAALRAAGDSYCDPIGVTWSLVERA